MYSEYKQPTEKNKAEYRQYVVEHPITDSNGFAAMAMLFAGVVIFAVLIVAAVSPLF